MTRRPTQDAVRTAVREVLEANPTLQQQPALRDRLAQSMVSVGLAAADLLEHDADQTDAIATRVTDSPQPVATAQAAGDQHARTATNSAAGTLRATRDAIDFPSFVTSLITGVFSSISTSSLQQLSSIGDLLEAVSMSAEEFGRRNITAGAAAEWAGQKWPGVFVMDTDEGELLLGDDADMPDAAALASELEASQAEVGQIDDGDLNATLLPLVQRKLGRERQRMLAVMVRMGLNRVVVDAGRLHASMDLRVDARSTAEQTQADRFDMRVRTAARGSFGAGIWGASASMSSNVGYVKSNENWSREDIEVHAGLRSNVDLNFHTEPVRLDQVADAPTRRTVERRAPGNFEPITPMNVGRATPGQTIDRNTARQTSMHQAPTGDAAQDLTADDPASQASRTLRQRRSLGPTTPAAPAGGTTAAAPAATPAAPAGGAGAQAYGHAHPMPERRPGCPAPWW